jgi:serine phosphatase RsbU (regulator of sigma subunit)/Flp pilus assembly protein TadD
MRLLLYILILGGLFIATAVKGQTGPEFYLIQDLVLAELSDDDRQLLDTNLKHYHSASIDTVRIDILNFIIEECWNDKVWPKYNSIVLESTKKLLNEADLENKKMVTKLKTILAGALNNEGYYYKDLGDIPLALDYYEQSLKMDESIGNKEGVATSLNNLGTIYLNQGMKKEALRYFMKSLALNEEAGDKLGISLSLNNVATIYFNEGRVDEAENYFERSYQLDMEINNFKGAANSLSNLGFIYKNTNRIDEALIKFNEALKLFRKVALQSGISLVQCNIGGLLFQEGNLNQAQLYTDSALVIGQKMGQPFSIKNASELMFRILVEKEQWKEALEMHQLFISMKDSLKNIETERKAEKQQMQYQFEKQHAIDEAAHDSQLLVVEAENDRRKLVNYFAIAGILVAAVFAYLMYGRLKITRKQKILIEEKNEELETQKKMVEEKNTEILDSIYYAERIQQALLKSEEHMSKNLPEHFILFKPKDILSGDFYWALEKDHYWYIAVADCTGHGVPGALLTMLGSSFMNEINQGVTVYSPAHILDRLRDKITQELSQSGQEGESTDGMDISLIKIDLNTLHAEWAGANNPLWVVKNGDNEVIELKADRQPIGYYEDPRPFKNNSIQLTKGDVFYLFSDGFVDQFGGDRGKKFKYKPFKDLLITFKEQPMEFHKKELEKRFTKWMGDYQQIDDVCIIGVRV